MQEHHPQSATELADALGTAARAGQSVQIAGNGTKTRWAGAITEADTCLRTTGLNRVLQYEPRDLTISVEAGMTYAALDSLLAANQQMVPLDPPYGAQATLGGILSANHSGPRRRLFGTARDLVIGMQFATVEGKLVQSGGMVVKNVAGLDMAKLLIGSWGTLGAMATVNFKLIPRDKATRTFLQSFASAKDALAERSRMLQSVLQPAAVDLLNPDASSAIGHQGWLLAVGVGGSEALVARYETEFRERFPTSLDGAAESQFWQSVQDISPRFLAAHTEGAILRCSTALHGLGAVLEQHEGLAIARAATGVAYLHYEDMPEKPPRLPEARCVFDAGPRNRATMDLWPEPGDDFAVMEQIKRMLDPQHLLNKGRLYGRI